MNTIVKIRTARHLALMAFLDIEIGLTGLLSGTDGFFASRIGKA